MKCPTCVEENEKSTVNVGGSTRTLMPTHTYYDEDGRYHHHDPNRIKTTYECSRGHRWSEETDIPCAACVMTAEAKEKEIPDEPK